MQTRIQGTVMPVLEVQLAPEESIFAESGELSWMTSSIQMSTHTQMGGMMLFSFFIFASSARFSIGT